MPRQHPQSNHHQLIQTRAPTSPFLLSKSSWTHFCRCLNFLNSNSRSSLGFFYPRWRNHGDWQYESWRRTSSYDCRKYKKRRLICKVSYFKMGSIKCSSLVLIMQYNACCFRLVVVYKEAIKRMKMSTRLIALKVKHNFSL